MLLGKTFSFTPDEANVDNLAKVCDLLIIFFCLLRILTFVLYTEKTFSFPPTNRMLKYVTGFWKRLTILNIS